MGAKFGRWMRRNLLLIMLGCMVVLVIFIDVVGIFRLATSRLTIWVAIGILGLLVIAALRERGMLSRRRMASGKEVIQLVEQRTNDEGRIALIRVTSLPLQLHQRLSKMIHAHGGWELVLYATSNPSSDRQRLVAEIGQLYLSRPISRTILGIIPSGWSWQKDVILVPELKSKNEELIFQSWPWQKLESQGNMPMRILVAFELSWPSQQGHSVDDGTQAWKVYETSKEATRLWDKLVKELRHATIITWSIFSEADWHALDLPKIQTSIADHFSARFGSIFRKFSFEGLRQWLRSADKLAIAVGFIGYMLSPFSPYNDLIVNVLPSFILASITVYFIPVSLTTAMLVYYISSNFIGILLLMWAVKRLSLDFTARLSKMQKIAIAAYIVGITLILSLLDIEASVQKIYQFLGR